MGADAFRRAVDLEPGPPALWWGLQREFALAGRGTETRQVVARALERFRWLPGLHVDAGVLAARAGDLEEARHRFARYLELDPRDANARRNLEWLLADPRWREQAGSPR